MLFPTVDALTVNTNRTSMSVRQILIRNRKYFPLYQSIYLDRVCEQYFPHFK